jgi:hypothetical protein
MNICPLGPPLFTLPAKERNERKTIMAPVPSTHSHLLLHPQSSLSLSLSIYLSMKSPSQLPPQYQHQLQLETPHYFNTLTTTAQTIYMFNIYDQNELFLSYHSLLVMENVCL